jgi:excinuclease ABC subunit C
VASMVVFEQGTPSKAHYRRFKIHCVENAPDDYASMREVLQRRLSRWKMMQEGAAPVGQKKDPSFAILPDLLMVDGGKGQLAEAVRVLDEFQLTGEVPVASLAKQREELFVPGRGEPILLPKDSQALFLVQRIRDEAHRFAIEYHRNVRNRTGLASQLERIPGIGPARRKALLREFGSLDTIRAASVEQLMKVRGVTEEIARRLQEG